MVGRSGIAKLYLRSVQGEIRRQGTESWVEDRRS